MLRVSSIPLNRSYSLMITNNKKYLKYNNQNNYQNQNDNNKTNNHIYKSNNDFTNNNIKIFEFIKFSIIINDFVIYIYFKMLKNYDFIYY